MSNLDTKPDLYLDLLQDMRMLLSSEWAHYKRDMPDGLCLSEDMCLLSSTYLYWMLKESGHHGWRPAEGIGQVLEPKNPGGMKDTAGRWSDHTWLVHESGWILDLTADQFGHDEIVFCPTADERYKENTSDTYALERVMNCSLGREWLQWQTEDPELADDLRSIRHTLSAVTNHPVSARQKSKAERAHCLDDIHP